MYTYIYDQKLNNPKYQKTLNKFELKMADLGISGDIIKLNQFQNIKTVIKEVLKGQSRNLIAVGSNDTAQAVSDALIQMDESLRKNITFGFVALLKPDSLSNVLGLPTGIAGLEAMSARIINDLDIFTINDDIHFYTYLDIGYADDKTKQKLGSWPLAGTNSFKTTVKLNNEFQVSLSAIKLQLFNINPFPDNSLNIDPQDGKLNIVALNEISKWNLTKIKKDILRHLWLKLPNLTFLSGDKIEISGDHPLNVFLGNKKVARTPIKITALDQKIRVIVGKGRKF